MNSITGSKLLTIHAKAGESYCIIYESGYTVNILNQTAGNIMVSPSPNYGIHDNCSECLVLCENAFYYGLSERMEKTLFITAEAEGNITVVRTDRDPRM